MTKPSPAHLIDDCFLHDKDRLRHDEVISILSERLACVTGIETVGLASAHGRILADDIQADRDVPLNDNAAVDGYAFRHGDAARHDGRLKLGQRIAAGHSAPDDLAPGSAARIFTGAVVPPNADTVAMQEDCTTENDHVRLPLALKEGANLRKAGEDVREGQTVLSSGTRLDAADIAAAASLGLNSIAVRRPLRVALISSGDELVRPGGKLGQGQVYDSNHFLLRSLCQSLPVEITDYGILPDRSDSVVEALQKASKENDLILATGGASRGEEDHMVAALDRLGQRHLWQIAIKPGRPMTMGQIGDRIVMGLPGNPVAVMVCFLLYGRLAVLRLCGASTPEPPRFMVPAAFAIKAKKPDRREFLRGRLVTGADGRLTVEKYARDGSGLISSLRESDGLIEIDEDTLSVEHGSLVKFIPFSAM